MSGTKEGSVASPLPGTPKPFQSKHKMEQSFLKEMGLEWSTPLSFLTLGQLVEVVQRCINAKPSKQERREYIYGLAGIQREFGVSHKCAQQWKDGFLAPAVEQQGKVIVIDKAMAHKLFKESGRNKK